MFGALLYTLYYTGTITGSKEEKKRVTRQMIWPAEKLEIEVILLHLIILTVLFLIVTTRSLLNFLLEKKKEDNISTSFP